VLWRRKHWAIAKYGVGVDNIDMDACKERDIKVSRTVGANSVAVADYAMALILAVARKTVLLRPGCGRREDQHCPRNACHHGNAGRGALSIVPKKNSPASASAEAGFCLPKKKSPTAEAVGD
jgi:hypothetical protein